MKVKDNLENMCLYKIQIDKRIARGHINFESKCIRCKGYDLYCDDYTPLICQKELVESMGGDFGI